MCTLKYLVTPESLWQIYKRRLASLAVRFNGFCRRTQRSHSSVQPMELIKTNQVKAFKKGDRVSNLAITLKRVIAKYALASKPSL